MSTTPTTPMSPRAQAVYDHIMAGIENWTDDKTRESVIELQQRIARYEREHQMSSATMRRKVIAGEIEETSEMCSWAFDLDELELLFGELA